MNMNLNITKKLRDIKFLEEENKKLKAELWEKIDTIQRLIREKYEEKGEKLELFKENKKLKKDLAETQKIGESWRQECKQLREELERLRTDNIYEEWLYD